MSSSLWSIMWLLSAAEIFFNDPVIWILRGWDYVKFAKFLLFMICDFDLTYVLCGIPWLRGQSLFGWEEGKKQCCHPSLDLQYGAEGEEGRGDGRRREAVDGLSTTVGGEPVARWGATQYHPLETLQSWNLSEPWNSLATLWVQPLRAGLLVMNFGPPSLAHMNGTKSYKDGKKQLNFSCWNHFLKFLKSTKSKSELLIKNNGKQHCPPHTPVCPR